jgi:hypothetical protein
VTDRAVKIRTTRAIEALDAKLDRVLALLETGPGPAGSPAPEVEAETETKAPTRPRKDR